MLVDTALGFETHKMAQLWQPLAHEPAKLEYAMLRLAVDGNVHSAFDRIFGAEGGCLAPEARQRCQSRLDDANFKKHALRYLRCFLPQSGFAFVPCLRYRINGRCGAKVVTTRHW